MKVIFRDSISGLADPENGFPVDFNFYAGQEVDIPRARAMAWCASGLCEAATLNEVPRAASAVQESEGRLPARPSRRKVGARA